jgi:alanine dehydrogenase
MLIGVPTEIKEQEYRVGMTPAGVRELVGFGHRILVQRDAGAAIGFSNEHYLSAGAELIETANEIFNRAELLVKVKEPQPEECRLLNANQILFTFLHLAPDPQLASLLLASEASCIAYETVTSASGSLPLLAPMSEVAGKLSIQAGAHHLEQAQNGSGTLLGGVPGVAPGKVLIVGGGVVGSNAAKIAIGMGAEVVLMDKSLPRLRELDELHQGRLQCLYATTDGVEQYAREADLIVGAVLLPGAAAPRILSREIISRMKPGSVVVDVAIDQGGCFETSRPTTHQQPTFVEQGVVHYCVTNMPGGVARTATIALTNATLPFVVDLANNGIKRALHEDSHLRNGLNIHAGRITCPAVANALGYPCQSAEEAVHLMS